MKKLNKDLSLAMLLSHSFGSFESVFTVANQYLFASLVTDNIIIKKAFKSALFDVINHIYLLGDLIIKLGGSPVCGEYVLGHVNYWNGYYVYYENNLESLLDVSINLEKKIIYSFHMILSEVHNNYVKNVVENILKDHYKYLNLWLNFKKSIV